MKGICRAFILIIPALLVVSLLFPNFCFASEAGAGKPITGLQVLQYGAIIPPHPGWVIAINPAFYYASLGGNVQTPIGGQLALNVDAEIGFAMFGITRVWKTDTTKWNFASGVVLPLANTKVAANVVVGPINGQREDDLFSQFDMVIVPLIASYHISQVEHLAFNMTIWAPTGDYEAGRLANNGMNVWSFIPNVAYTKIWPASNVSFDATYGMEIDTENPDTDYQNGILTNLDMMVVKKFKNNWGVGGVFGWIEQYTDDEGGLADRLDGFKGRALGIGPYVTYSTKIGKETDLSFNARFIWEFETKNRPEGYPILISTSFIF